MRQRRERPIPHLPKFFRVQGPITLERSFGHDLLPEHEDRGLQALLAAERATLVETGLDLLLERAPDVGVPKNGARVFSHAKMAASGHLVGAVARPWSGRVRIRSSRSACFDEELSLDGFLAMLALAAGRERKRPPRVCAQYPFLVGDDPQSLPGLDEVAQLAEQMPIVATTDPIHHGAGYSTTEGERPTFVIPRPRTRAFTRTSAMPARDESE